MKKFILAIVFISIVFMLFSCGGAPAVKAGSFHVQTTAPNQTSSGERVVKVYGTSA